VNISVAGIASMSGIDSEYEEKKILSIKPVVAIVNTGNVVNILPVCMRSYIVGSNYKEVVLINDFSSSILHSYSTSTSVIM